MQVSIGTPYIEVIAGPMYSGKSHEIDRRLTNLDYYNSYQWKNGGERVSYIVLRPNIDTRSNKIRELPYEDKNWRFVESDNLERSTYDDGDFYEELDLDKYDMIVLDEAQFFNSKIILQVNNLLKKNKYVLISGLDKDYLGLPFSEFMKWAVCVCDDIVKLTAICSKCGAPSTMARMESSNPEETLKDNIIVEDEHHRYIPICRKCMNELGGI